MQQYAAKTSAGGTSAASSLIRSRFHWFAWIVLAYNVAVIVWGALVRATGSGAGCGGHWPLCNGEVLPLAPATATVIELTHRAMSGLALIAVVALFAWAYSAYSRRHPVRVWAAWSLVFILTEALLGAALVLLGHVAANESAGRIYSLSAHLINTFLLLAALALTAWCSAAEIAQPSSNENFANQELRRRTAVLGAPLVAIIVVAVAGAITALGDTLFPAHTLAQGVADDFASTSSFLVRLRVIHPLLAIAAGGFLALLAAREYHVGRTRRLRWLSGALLVLITAEITAGASNILLRAPLPLQLVHLFLADCLWITLVLFTIERRRAGNMHLAASRAGDPAPDSAGGRTGVPGYG